MVPLPLEPFQTRVIRPPKCRKIARRHDAKSGGGDLPLIGRHRPRVRLAVTNGSLRACGRRGCPRNKRDLRARRHARGLHDRLQRADGHLRSAARVHRRRIVALRSSAAVSAARAPSIGRKQRGVSAFPTRPFLCVTRKDRFGSRLLPDVGGSAASPRAADIKSHGPICCRCSVLWRRVACRNGFEPLPPRFEAGRAAPRSARTARHGGKDIVTRVVNRPICTLRFPILRCWAF
jgi:hypothetical protein